MEAEIEAKFTDVDTQEVRSKLQAIGAVLHQPEQFMRRCVFDFPDKSLMKKGGWVRVRDEGKKITLSYKQLVDRSVTGTKEVSVNVNHFEETIQLLQEIGLENYSYQETKRETWKWNHSEITIDTWPWIPTFVEIESPTECELKEVVKQLDFDWKKATHGSVEIVYQQHFDVTEEEVDHWPQITFVPVPEWLEQKRRNKS